ncbi:MAG: T9SS type A sorting domain-containing protein [Prevotella sp.]|nr:T9SS type A sorting domain-containing protein [Prevotella sp.]
MMKTLHVKIMTAATALLVILMIHTVPAIAQDGVWRTTIIIKTLDGGKAEYLIDKDTKVSIEQPNLVIETDGMVLTYALESMNQVSYGRKFISSGISSPAQDEGNPVSVEKEMLFLSGLSENTQVDVYNAEGKTMMSQRYSGSAQVSLHMLPTGIYFVKINNETYKILKK